MPSAFQQLQLPVSLFITEEQIKEAFQNSKRLEADISARNILLNKHSLLSNWMTANHIEIRKHSIVPDSIVPLFSEIAILVNEVKEIAQKKTTATSFLSQTLLDKKLFEIKPKLDATSEQHQSLKNKTLENFSILEQTPDGALANTTLQTLKFLAKWEQQLNECYAALIG